MNNINKIKNELKSFSNTQKAQILQRFFKTGKGDYGEGDKFIGVAAPNIRKVVKLCWKEISLSDCTALLRSPIHEERFCALLIMVAKFQKEEKLQKEIYNLYLTNTKYVNNWDLVDMTAPHIVGQYLFDKERSVLYKLAISKSLWERRISVLSTFYFISKQEYKDSLKIAKILLYDQEDLIHKAVGWMLREVGKRCSQKILEDFLIECYKEMPRTMLRYAIERLPEKFLDKQTHTY